MSTVMFKRGDDITMDNTPIQDGLLFFNEEDHKIYMDNGNQRLQYGGDTALISSASQASSTNAFNASASVNLFLQKTTVVDTKANALAVTQNYIPLGCLAFKEMLGTSNYSSVGASVSAALINLANRASTLENKTTVNNVPFYFDYHDGKYGYNTNANRGADTFHPFSGGLENAIELGNLGNAFDLTSYTNYQNFTTDKNFFVRISGVSFSGANASTSGSDWDSGDFNAQGGASASSMGALLSYNASTGRLTTAGGMGIGVSVHLGGPHIDASNSSSGTLSIIGKVYLLA